jgi:ABC-type multidrug transport system fused ATPase/permease subunit
VKSLQMEPRLESRYDEMLAQYLAAGFGTRQLSNTYNVIANALEQAMTLAILCVGALLVMRNDGFTIGMLVAFQMFAGRLSQPMLRLAGLWQEFQQTSIAVKRLGDMMNIPPSPTRWCRRSQRSAGASICWGELSLQRPASVRLPDFNVTLRGESAHRADGAFRLGEHAVKLCSVSTRPPRADPDRRPRPAQPVGQRAALRIWSGAAGDGAVLRDNL